MVKYKIYILFLICSVSLLSSIGCTDLTEYEIAINAGLYVISPNDFTQINTVSNLSGASALLLEGEDLFILSTEGFIYRFDTLTMEQTGEFTIGVPSAAAYSKIVFSNTKHTAYLIGNLGNIIEISIPDCTVIDEFSVCESPIELLLATDSEYLFVADGPSSKLHQVAINGNTRRSNVFLYYPILSMAACENPDSFVVGTSDGLNYVEVLPTSGLRSGRLTSEGKAYSAMEAVLEDTILVGMRNNFVGIIDAFHPEPMPGPYFYDAREVPGSYFSVAMGRDFEHAYILSYIGNNTSRLTSYNYLSSEEPMELDLNGYPIDLKVSESGDIYVLTTE